MTQRLYIALAPLLILLFVSPRSGSADIQLCEGVWSTRPCEGNVEKEVKTRELSAEEQKSIELRSKKRTLLHNLTMETLEARREYGVDLSLEGAQEVCRSEKSSIEECAAKTEAHRDTLTKRIRQELELIKAKREAEEAKKPQQTQSAGTTNIIIDERPQYILHPRRRKKRRYGNHVGHHSAGGASITVNGSNANGSISVGAHVGGSSHSTQHTSQTHVISGHQRSGNRTRVTKQKSGSSFGRSKGVKEPFSAIQYPSPGGQ